MFGLTVFLLIYSFFVFYAPNFLASSDNYIPANPMQTPNHIVPEWYLLPYYAILRSVPNKLLGVILAFGSIGLLFVVPWLDTSPVRSARFRPVYKWVFWLLVDRRDRARLGRRQSSRRSGGDRRADRDALLLRPFPDPVPGYRQARAAATTAASIATAVLQDAGGARLGGAGAPLAKS